MMSIREQVQDWRDSAMHAAQGSDDHDEILQASGATEALDRVLVLLDAGWHETSNVEGFRGLAFGSLWKPDRCSECNRWPETAITDQQKRTCAGCLVTFRRKTGTGDMVSRMLDAGIPVRWVVSPEAAAVDLREMPGEGSGGT